MALARVDQNKAGRAIFGTLTYPNEFPFEYVTFKAHLDAFGKRFLRAFPDAGFFWKLEFQKRGAPHFHPIFFCLDVSGSKLFRFREWLSQTWYEVVASGDLKHLHAGTSAELMRSQFAIMRYCAGYVSKGDQTLSGVTVGRYWGIVGRGNIPLGVEETLLLSHRQAMLVRRTMRRSMQAANRVRRVAHHQLGPEFYLSGRVRLLRKRAPQLNIFRRVPRKLRSRNNKTVHLFCSADRWSVHLRSLLALLPYETVPPPEPKGEGPAVPPGCLSAATGKTSRQIASGVLG